MPSHVASTLYHFNRGIHGPSRRHSLSNSKLVPAYDRLRLRAHDDATARRPMEGEGCDVWCRRSHASQRRRRPLTTLLSTAKRSSNLTHEARWPRNLVEDARNICSTPLESHWDRGEHARLFARTTLISLSLHLDQEHHLCPARMRVKKSV